VHKSVYTVVACPAWLLHSMLQALIYWGAVTLDEPQGSGIVA
jgi:hypothetical protein